MVEGCPETKPREPEEEFQERGDHRCGYIRDHAGQHVCACGKAKWPNTNPNRARKA